MFLPAITDILYACLPACLCMYLTIHLFICSSTCILRVMCIRAPPRTHTHTHTNAHGYKDIVGHKPSILTATKKKAQGPSDSQAVENPAKKQAARVKTKKREREREREREKKTRVKAACAAAPIRPPLQIAFRNPGSCMGVVPAHPGK
jgi:hypothetical protein